MRFVKSGSLDRLPGHIDDERRRQAAQVRSFSAMKASIPTFCRPMAFSMRPGLDDPGRRVAGRGLRVIVLTTIAPIRLSRSSPRLLRVSECGPKRSHRVCSRIPARSTDNRQRSGVGDEGLGLGVGKGSRLGGRLGPGGSFPLTPAPGPWSLSPLAPGPTRWTRSSPCNLGGLEPRGRPTAVACTAAPARAPARRIPCRRRSRTPCSPRGRAGRDLQRLARSVPPLQHPAGPQA